MKVSSLIVSTFLATTLGQQAITQKSGNSESPQSVQMLQVRDTRVTGFVPEPHLSQRFGNRVRERCQTATPPKASDENSVKGPNLNAVTNKKNVPLVLQLFAQMKQRILDARKAWDNLDAFDQDHPKVTSKSGKRTRGALEVAVRQAEGRVVSAITYLGMVCTSKTPLSSEARHALRLKADNAEQTLNSVPEGRAEERRIVTNLVNESIVQELEQNANDLLKRLVGIYDQIDPLSNSGDDASKAKIAELELQQTLVTRDMMKVLLKYTSIKGIMDNSPDKRITSQDLVNVSFSAIDTEKARFYNGEEKDIADEMVKAYRRDQKKESPPKSGGQTQ